MPSLEELMAGAARELTSSMQAARIAFEHNATKGASIEGAVRDFFAKHYPESIGVATGLVVDSKGNSSKQLDVILYDKLRTPVLYTDSQGQNRLIPSEGVIAAVEVKTRLALGDIPTIAESARTLKSLDRSALYENADAYQMNAYGRSWPGHMPPMYFVVAFEGPRLENVLPALGKEHAGRPFHKRVDMMCILDRGLVMNWRAEPGRPEGLPSPQTCLAGADSASQTLLLFHVLASRWILQASEARRPIALHNYVEDGRTFGQLMLLEEPQGASPNDTT